MRMQIGQGTPPRGILPSQWKRMEEVRNYLCSYSLCAEMLEFHRYERKRAPRFSDPCQCEEILLGNPRFWRARMYSVGRLISLLPNGREKLVLYYHYIHGESIEHVSDVLDVSRRTGYRAHMRGLYMLSCIFSGYLSKTNTPSVLNTNEKNQEKVE